MNGYKQYLKLKNTKNKGKGVFTDVEIPAKTPLLEVKGQLGKELEFPENIRDNLYQVGPEAFIGLSGDLDDYINHSCDPNCFLHIVGVRAILYSLYKIPAGAEITFDYSSSSTDSLETWKMPCSCGSPKCRKLISGYQYLDQEVLENYKKRGILPQFIREKFIVAR